MNNYVMYFGLSLLPLGRRDKIEIPTQEKLFK